jgi:hypothetical protein
MKQLAKGLAGLAGYTGGLVGMTIASTSNYLNQAEKLFTFGVGAVLTVFGLSKVVDAISEEDNYIVNRIANHKPFKRKQKTQMSLEEAYAQIDKKYNERLESFLEATSHPTEREGDNNFRMKRYMQVMKERQEEKTGLFHYKHCKGSPRLTLDTSSSRQSYEEKLNAFYEAHCKAA